MVDFAFVTLLEPHILHLTLHGIAVGIIVIADVGIGIGLYPSEHIIEVGIEFEGFPGETEVYGSGPGRY